LPSDRLGQNSAVSSIPTFWLGRQPILDASGRTYAYELLFRSADGDNTGAVHDNRNATTTVIAHAFGELGLANVLGNCRGFINFDESLLMSDLVELMPPERTVIELLESVRITPEVVSRCRALRSRGFAFALDDVVQIDDTYAPLMPLVEVVKIDVLDASPDELPRLVRQARAAGPVKLLAEKVDNREQADRCRALGFDLFQGYFFARPTILKGRRADPSKRVLLDLLRETLGDADNARIEAIFKESPELSYKLIRLVNSVGMGMPSSIQSLSHALMILGRRQLQRWVQVLLFAQQGTTGVTSPLLPMATARGKLMELLAQEQAAEPSFTDRAFMTGILSLLDALLEIPMPEIVEQLNLPDDASGALLDRDGSLGQLLKTVEALERADDAAMAALFAAATMTSDELARLQVQALNFANEIGRLAED
jgi:c-di-GMP-related signal transduction protein